MHFKMTPFAPASSGKCSESRGRCLHADVDDNF